MGKTTKSSKTTSGPHKSAVTGKFVTTSYAKSHPNTTYKISK